MTDREELENHILGYFELGVLAFYRSEPDKYQLDTDYFEGRLHLTEQAFSTSQTGETIDIRFGYRTLQSGDLALVAYLPDLVGRSPAHVKRWRGFHLEVPVWTATEDERFTLWKRRYLDGDWNVDNGPRTRLEQTVARINALTQEVVGNALFRYAANPTMNFPSAQNTHAYEDAHRELYNYLIDGLDKNGITALSTHMGHSINFNNDNTVNALKRVVTDHIATATLWQAFNVVSTHRRAAGHAVRSPALRCPAFEQFSGDLEACVTGSGELLAVLEGALGMTGERAEVRQSAKRGLPTIGRPAVSHYSVSQLPLIQGKTVEHVEIGFREDIEGVHGSEAMIIYFTDGSILGVDTGSNATNIAQDRADLRAEEIHVDFALHWVPPPQ